MSYRIAMLGACPFPVPQGSQVLLADTARGMQALGHEVHLVTYGYGLGADPPGLRIHRCAKVPGATQTAAGPHWAKPILDALLIATLRDVVQRERIDLVHAHNYEALLVALAVGKRPIVYHAHNALEDELPLYLPNIPGLGRLGAWTDRTLPRRADAIVAPHQRLANHLVACGCDAARIAVVPPPCEAGQFDPCDVQPGLPPIVYTGNLDAYQNIPLLEKAFRRVRTEEVHARLMIATRDEVRIPGAERVAVASLAQLKEALARDCVVACPRVSWSGYPIKLLNAMAAGKAIVACEGAAPPIVHGENGLLVPANDAEAFAQALFRAMRSAELRRSLGARAREHVVQAHRPEAIARQIEAVYREVLERPRPVRGVAP